MATTTTALDLLPTPSVTPPPPLVVTPELPVQINAVTRKHHIELNRLIIDRLPLALPPSANGPQVYALGLAAFAQIYLAFEQAFDDLERTQDDSAPTEEDEETAHKREIKAWLSNLRPPGLKRSPRIKRDLQYLPEQDRFNFSTLDNEIQSHIRDLAATKPHILVAYTWVMYMAIFSGGRWIRSQLASAQPEFWTSHTNAGPALAEKTPSGMPGFSFLSFDGDEDGEDIKVEYKRRLAEGEDIVSTQEREEIMQAAQELFERCISIVHKLDEEVRRQEILKRLLPLALMAAVVTFALAYYRLRH